MKQQIIIILLFVAFLFNYLILSQTIQECGTFIPSGVTLQQAGSGDLTLFKPKLFIRK